MNDKTKKPAAEPQATNAAQGMGQQARKPSRADLDAALAELPGPYTDADYVCVAMSEHYGEHFTAEDEKRVRELVKPPAPKAKLEVGSVVEVLDWTRDANAPVTCTATVSSLNRDGTIDVDVTPPAGIEPYSQVGLRESPEGEHVPGTWRHVAGGAK